MKFSVSAVSDRAHPDFSKFDVVILSITGESRAWLVAEKLRGLDAKVWALARRNENLSSINLEKEIERRIPGADVVLAQSFASTLSAFLATAVGEVSIFMDVSCMTRKDMALAFDEIFSLDRSNLASITIALGYVISKFVPPDTIGCHNEDIRPISPRFAGWPSDPYAPTSVVMGLGYEAAKAEGANEYFDAQETWVFFPHSPIPEFDAEVLKNNKQMIERAQRETKLVSYPVDNPMESFFYLNSLVQDLSERSNLLILPFGPKIFAAIAMLVAISHPSVGVWHATGDTDLPAYDHEASEHFVTMELTFSANI